MYPTPKFTNVHILSFCLLCIHLVLYKTFHKVFEAPLFCPAYSPTSLISNYYHKFGVYLY